MVAKIHPFVEGVDLYYGMKDAPLIRVHNPMVFLCFWPVFEERNATVMQLNNEASLITTPNQVRIKLIDKFINAFARSSSQVTKTWQEPVPWHHTWYHNIK